MTNEMLKDFIDVLKRRNIILIILTVIFAVGFIGMTIFAFSNFEIVTETETTIEYDAETGDGENAYIQQINDMSKTTDNSVWIICFTILFCTIVMTIGFVLYGKIKNENHSTQARYNSEKISRDDEEEEKVTI